MKRLFCVVFFRIFAQKMLSMANKGFKILSSLSLLLLYLMVMVVSNVSIMFCECHSHKTHQDAGRLHQSEHCCSCGVCYTFDAAKALFADRCGCKHDHSNKVDLYTFSRSWNDDSIVRYLLLCAPIANVLFGDYVADEAFCVEYGGYLQPPLSSAVKGSVSLRAPPQLV